MSSDAFGEYRWYSPHDTRARFQCPCCDYVSLPERGCDLVCAVCFWEDDGQDLDELNEVSGPNHGLTLAEGRSNFASIGACCEAMLPHVLKIDERSKFELKPRETSG